MSSAVNQSAISSSIPNTTKAQIKRKRQKGREKKKVDQIFINVNTEKKGKDRKIWKMRCLG